MTERKMVKAAFVTREELINALKCPANVQSTQVGRMAAEVFRLRAKVRVLERESTNFAFRSSALAEEAEIEKQLVPVEIERPSRLSARVVASETEVERLRRCLDEMQGDLDAQAGRPAT